MVAAVQYVQTRARISAHGRSERPIRLRCEGKLQAVPSRWAPISNTAVNKLIPLYAVGVFTGSNLSQAETVVHRRRERGPGWRHSAVINGAGAVATGIVIIVIAASTISHVAWLTVLPIPVTDQGVLRDPRAIPTRR